MRAGRKIAILLHERDAYPAVKVHFIWALCELWRAAGMEIEVLKGPENADAEVNLARSGAPVMKVLIDLGVFA